MGKIYSTQPFKVELSYTDLPATPAKIEIEYRKPDGRRGRWPAQINMPGKKIYYWSNAGEKLGMAGTWSFWSVITDANGDEYPGEPVQMVIWGKGS